VENNSLKKKQFSSGVLIMARVYVQLMHCIY